jgi:hypothetical protein
MRQPHAEAKTGADSSTTREVTRRLEQSGRRSPRNRPGREECNAQAQRRCQQIGNSAHGAIPAGRPRPDRARLATAEALVRGAVTVAPPGGPRMPPDERLSRIALRSCSRAPRGSAGARRRRRRPRRADIGRSRACTGLPGFAVGGTHVSPRCYSASSPQDGRSCTPPVRALGEHRDQRRRPSASALSWSRRSRPTGWNAPTTSVQRTSIRTMHRRPTGFEAEGAAPTSRWRTTPPRRNRR